MAIHLHYFNIYARGEPIRVILHYANVPFEDHQYAFEEWPPIQQNFEFLQLPCLEIDGHRLVQSKCISRYLCQKLGYHNPDLYLDYLSTSLVEAKDDFVQKKIQMVYFEKNPEGFVDWVKTEYSHTLNVFQQRYVANGETGFFVGNSPTIGDFEIFTMLHDQFIRDFAKEKMLPILQEAAPKLIDFVEKFKNSSESLLKYLECRPFRLF